MEMLVPPDGEGSASLKKEERNGDDDDDDVVDGAASGVDVILRGLVGWIGDA